MNVAPQQTLFHLPDGAEPAGAQAVGGHSAGGRSFHRLPPGTVTDAEFGGPDGEYRYKLSRRWGPGSTILFAMMNPSVADYRFDDPTVAKCGRIARRLGHGALLVANACAYRATDRMQLLSVADPVGPRNREAIAEMAIAAETVVVAHGRLPGNLQVHADAMVEILLASGRDLHVLRLTHDDVPVHPLARGRSHIPEDVKLVLWKKAA